MATTRRKKSRIPRFKTLEEEAEFWDTHDSAEFEDEFSPVDITFARPLRHIYELEVNADLLNRLSAYSGKHGVNLDELLGSWIEERLATEEGREAQEPESGNRRPG